MPIFRLAQVSLLYVVILLNGASVRALQTSQSNSGGADAFLPMAQRFGHFPTVLRTLELGVPRSLPGSVHLSERRWRSDRHCQLSEPNPKASGRRARNSQTELPGAPPHDGDSGAESGIGEGHPVSPAALASGHDSERVHAGVAGECAADGRNGLRDAHVSNRAQLGAQV